MILPFSWWFVAQVLHHYLLMRTYPKYRNRRTNGRFDLIMILQKKSRDCFLMQKNPSNHRDINFNNMLLKRKNIQKHLGLHLDPKLHFFEHINEKLNKAVKGIRVIKKLNVTY